MSTFKKVLVPVAILSLMALGGCNFSQNGNDDDENTVDEDEMQQMQEDIADAKLDYKEDLNDREDRWNQIQVDYSASAETHATEIDNWFATIESKIDGLDADSEAEFDLAKSDIDEDFDSLDEKLDAIENEADENENEGDEGVSVDAGLDSETDINLN